ncbi:hypothetical protein SAY86_007526 [Trapa natans]|uniref:DNA-directed RNA polymerase subunit n=1 Tax=Trapa natans TaxID=22666 RepID=A0AAN7QXY7_TRANT|nr:hypothetical protein SAY86_007526 [Trapa natans]
MQVKQTIKPASGRLFVNDQTPSLALGEQSRADTMEAKLEERETEVTGTGTLEADITGITFGLASRDEMRKASINECPITHASQLYNPFLGLPLEFGRCESCGTSDPSQCEGHFGYIELPIPIYHPSHVSELKNMLGLVCLKCLKMRDNKFPVKAGGLGEKLLGACCEEASQVSVSELKKSDGACTLQLRLLSKSRYHKGFWNFMEKYGYRYGTDIHRTLLPCEALRILKKLPKETKKKLAAKGYFPQDGYILQVLPVPPNCLRAPDVSDNGSIMSSDLSVSVLKKVLKQIEIIRRSRSGTPNFESQEIEANGLQTVVQQYLEVRGTSKAARDVDTRYGVHKESSGSTTKAWLEKMRTLFIKKGSGFSSRSVITGDAYQKVNEIGIPYEIAQRITFEEKVSNYNVQYLQELVDKKLCLAYTDGATTYSLREGSKGHAFLKLGQVVHRRIMDGDIVFVNRPPTTHKHSLQALSVYVHEDHTVKINPLICSPLSADFDGDCIHLFYPQSFSAKAEVLELFSVEKQLLSSHSGNLNLQLASDSLLSLKLMFKRYFFDKPYVQQLAMFMSSELPRPAILKAEQSGAFWSAIQILQTALPSGFDCTSDKYFIRKGDILSINFGRDVTPLMLPSKLSSMLNEIITDIIFKSGPHDVLTFFNSLQPLLMESVFSEGYSLSLHDFYAPKSAIRDIQENISDISHLLFHLKSSHSELVQRQLGRDIRRTKDLLLPFIFGYSAVGGIIDSRSESAITKIIQQIGFLGLQLSNRGKFYSETLFEEMAALFERKYPFNMVDYPAGKFGMIRSSFISGLDPYEVLAHSISSREVIVRSRKGLSESGTLFKNLMAILRDVVICYDGTVRNISSNSIIQFEYGAGPGSKPETLFPPGEPVGVLAATAMSYPAYKAVLDSSPKISSWEHMKEILQCQVNFRNELIDRRIILYLNECGCGRNHCQENAACIVKNHLKKITLKDVAVDFMVEFRDQRTILKSPGMHTGLVAHIHLNEVMLRKQNISILDVEQRCQETLQKFMKKKIGFLFKKILISVSDGCNFHHLRPAKKSEIPCLSFSSTDSNEVYLEKYVHIFANAVCPVLLDTIIKGDPRIASANITWVSPDMSTSVKNPGRGDKGELALEITLEKPACKQSGDAWRIIMDCCLPILHLIDTRRSVPYAVKQIEELLGIPCAFDQAAQRLSTSLAMVEKGILKEHFILLADTMTCSGTLIGFNSGGYKALSRALGVQVPFTEATLFTPRKCFEKASEKSNTDSLSSVVASCSWGKPVAVGTGSMFDLLWDKRKVELKHDGEIDVYSFLHMVRGKNFVSGLDTDCLGAEVDHLNEGENMDLCPSPDNYCFSEKPSFEDSEQLNGTFKDQHGKSGWDNAGLKHAKGDSWSSWDRPDSSQKVEDSYASGGWGSSSWRKNTEINTSKPEAALSSSWPGWNEDKVQTQDDGILCKEAEGARQLSKDWNNNNDDSSKVDRLNDLGWGKKPGEASLSSKELPKKGEDVSTPEADGWTSSGRGKKSEAANQSPSDWTEIGNPATSKNDGWTSWGRGKKSEVASQSSTDWSKKDDASTPGVDGWTSSGWGKESEANTSPNEWTKKDDLATPKNDGWTSSGWGKKSEANKTPNEWTEKGDPPKNDGWTSSGWGKKSEADKTPNEWTEKGDPPKNDGWTSSVWGKKSEANKTPNEWTEKGDPPKNDGWTSSGWGKKSEADKTPNEWTEKGDPPKNDGWTSSGGGKKSEAYKSPNEWTKKGDPAAPKNDGWTSSGWGEKSEANKSPNEWTKKGDPIAPKNDGWTSSGWGEKSEANKSPNEWTKKGDRTAPKNDGSTSSGWGEKSEANKSPNEWTKKGDSVSPKNDGWTSSGWGKKSEVIKSPNEWTKKGNSASPKNDGWTRSGWGKKSEAASQSSDDWSKKDGASTLKGEGWTRSGWGKKSEASQSPNDWTKKDDLSTPKNDDWGSSSWGKRSVEGDLSCKGWTSSEDTEDSKSQNPWAPKEWRMNKDGTKQRGSHPEWKIKKNRPPRPQDSSQRDPNAPHLLTATKQRLDMFTSEEQNILCDVEPIMLSIRRIMRQAGYNDSDPLSAEDQSCIVDSVLNHHPDKAQKIGSGIDHIMVSKHSTFQDTRCFYVVRADGGKEDFSYRKCLESYIKGKYPHLAEEFIGKYFVRRDRERTRGSREPSASVPPPEDAWTPGD